VRSGDDGAEGSRARLSIGGDVASPACEIASAGGAAAAGGAVASGRGGGACCGAFGRTTVRSVSRKRSATLVSTSPMRSGASWVISASVTFAQASSWRIEMP
jgi:hypothetical protein